MIEMEQTRERILVVDDEPDICWAIEHILKEKGVASQKALSAQEALKLIGSDKFRFVFLDAKLPDMDGIELARRIREVDPAIIVVLISGYFRWDDDCIQEVRANGIISGFISKPFINSEILKALEVAISGEPLSQKVK